jgi:probable rRNA maturation factor
MKFSLINHTSDVVLKTHRSDITKLNAKISTTLKLSKTFNYALILIDDAGMLELNRTYRQLDKTTDVISFALNDGIEEASQFMDELGDIFINVDAVFRQAEAYGHSVRREFLFLIAHGILHLLGYDHMTPTEEKVMFELQKELLNDLATR